MINKKRESQSISIRLDKTTYDRLTGFCNDMGQTKTLAIERAINMYIDSYEAMAKRLSKNK